MLNAANEKRTIEEPVGDEEAELAKNRVELSYTNERHPKLEKFKGYGGMGASKRIKGMPQEGLAGETIREERPSEVMPSSHSQSLNNRPPSQKSDSETKEGLDPEPEVEVLAPHLESSDESAVSPRGRSEAEPDTPPRNPDLL